MKTNPIILIALAILIGTLACAKDDPFLTLDNYAKAVTDKQGSFTIQVTSNVSWAAICAEDWCTVSASGVGNGIILVTYDKNSTISSRSAEIMITGYGLSNQKVTVTQDASSLTIGLVAYYPFNGNAMDASGNGRHGNIQGATLTTDRKNVPDKAFNFNGSSSYISLPNNIWSDELSLSVWFNAKNFGGTNPNTSGKVILFKSPDSGYSRDFTLGLSNINYQPKFNFIFGNSQVEYFYIENQTAFNANSWYNLVVTRKAGVVKLYVNGVLDATANYSFIPINHGYNFKIGTSMSSFQTFDGYLDDIRIYNRALTDTEVSDVYTE